MRHSKIVFSNIFRYLDIRILLIIVHVRCVYRSCILMKLDVGECTDRHKIRRKRLIKNCIFTKELDYFCVLTDL